ncbi:cytochrome c oxidase assembly protein [Chelativorans sp. AA-79]|uniref:cytochrome c oxidase assembly protein n=1 Tax=Chelativorans sp. AA-79 TaxID=3028735 RepID=UPI0023F94898|nr:cytochrome c oxidase assembly protein [Chelativorans sp. AA-79]WEX10196.1 cytochrome c oxidase assembly protein [Chelativorans sp. AA-79]
MAVHILAMNVAAPALVLAWRLVAPPRVKPPDARWIGPAAALQVGLLWVWHLPLPLAFAYSVTGGEVLMHLSLFAAALWFWRAVLDEAEAARWRALGALLLTGKLFCLLGVLLTFAPRSLYLRAAELCLGGRIAPEALLADQQLAGLMMLVACPLVYVLAGIIIAARWLREIESRKPTYLPEGNG